MNSYYAVSPRGVEGYTYQADCVCRECMIWQVGGTKAGIEFHGDAEQWLDAMAQTLGIDRGDEHSFDSDFFPKVICAPSGEEWDCLHCGDSCGEVIG